MSKQEKEKQTYMFGGLYERKEFTLLYFSEKGSYYTHSDEKSAESEGYDGHKEQFGIKRDFEKNTLSEIFEMSGKTYLIDNSLKRLIGKF